MSLPGSPSAAARSHTPTDAVIRRPSASGRAGGDRGPRPLGREQRLLRGRVGQQPGELLAADAPDRVDRARLRGDPPGRLGEHPVADRMAVLVVDRLEAVEVHDDEPERAPTCAEPRGLLGQACAE
jgi:hypothetical protein